MRQKLYNNRISITTQADVVVTPYTRIREVLRSKLGQGTCDLEDLHDFPHFLHENDGMVPKLGRGVLTFHRSSIPPFDTIQSSF
jgi:hypothetical protein